MSHHQNQFSKRQPRKRVCVPAAESITEAGLVEALAVGAVREVSIVEQPDGWFRVKVQVRFVSLGDKGIQERWLVATRRSLREWRGLERLTSLLIGMPGMPQQLSLHLHR